MYVILHSLSYVFRFKTGEKERGVWLNMTGCSVDSSAHVIETRANVQNMLCLIRGFNSDSL